MKPQVRYADLPETVNRHGIEEVSWAGEAHCFGQTIVSVLGCAGNIREFVQAFTDDLHGISDLQLSRPTYLKKRGTKGKEGIRVVSRMGRRDTAVIDIQLIPNFDVVQIYVQNFRAASNLFDRKFVTVYYMLICALLASAAVLLNNQLDLVPETPSITKWAGLLLGLLIAAFLVLGTILAGVESLAGNDENRRANTRRTALDERIAQSVRNVLSKFNLPDSRITWSNS